MINKLEIIPHEETQTWWGAYIVSPTRRAFLGACPAEQLIEKFGYLLNNIEKLGIDDDFMGLTVRCVMSFSEAHCSVYMVKEKEWSLIRFWKKKTKAINIFIQNEKGEITHFFPLKEEEKKQWKYEISRHKSSTLQSYI
ncbi:MAG: hypothetical protein COB02_15880 [Candidatus Cloacimonadota bacterium]|nr:MAG: hypothetical protein COB02_15880 [Candidatus Cloacimonadota bacterium]